jgi:hypothetical protein
MTEIHKHRRFRFGLRTFFVVITAIAIWLGWNVQQVRKRAGVERFILTSSSGSQVITYGPPIRPWKSLPVTWRFLGAKPVTSISLKFVRLEEGDLEQIRASFPEAEITEIQFPIH